jgi:hypothetical protein
MKNKNEKLCAKYLGRRIWIKKIEDNAAFFTLSKKDAKVFNSERDLIAKLDGTGMNYRDFTLSLV